MKKNVLKKVVTAIVTTAMVVCAVVANPTEAKAATDKTIIITGASEATYSLGFWSPSGVTMNADDVTSDAWTYAFKATDNGYELTFSVEDGWTATGLSISVDGAETYKADPEWSGDAGAAGWKALTEALAAGDTAYIKLVENDTQATIEVVEAPAGDSADTESTTPDTEASKTGDASMVALFAVVALAAVAVVLNKKTVTE